MKTIKEKLDIVIEAVETGHYAQTTENEDRLLKDIANAMEIFTVDLQSPWFSRIERHYQACLDLGIADELERNATEYIHINAYTSLHTGGNVWVDVIELNDETTLGITPESITLYDAGLNELENDMLLDSVVLGEADLSRYGTDRAVGENEGIDGLTFVTRMSELHHKRENVTTFEDWIRLYNDITIHIFNDSIKIYDATESADLSEIDSIERFPKFCGNDPDQQLDQKTASSSPPSISEDDKDRYVEIMNLLEQVMKWTHDLQQEINATDDVFTINAILEEKAYPFPLQFNAMAPQIIIWCQTARKALHRLK